MTGRLKQSLFHLQVAKAQRRLHALLDNDNLALRHLVIAIFIIQAAGCLAAWHTNVMLHGDGAYFVYALSAGEAWMLKWSDIAARAAVYVTTVLPTWWMALLLHLGPLEISRLNGFIFYLVPALQFAVACALIWRSHPQYLIFPAAQYSLSTAIGYGFPSEILLAPGFLWIALFLILKDRVFNSLFFISFAGALFSHELAFPAVLVTAYLAIRKIWHEDRYGLPARIAGLGAIVATFVFFFYVLINGGAAGSHSNAIYVIDPRRVLNNPTLWVILTACAAAWTATHRFSDLARKRVEPYALVFGAFAVPLILRLTVPEINFEQGRYESARSIIGAIMFLLALCFAIAQRGNSWSASGAPYRVSNTTLILSVALAVSVGSSIVFLYDWCVSLRGLQRVIAPVSADMKPEFVRFEKVLALMPPLERLINDRMDFQWTLPYRAVVLADGRVPARVPFVEGDYRSYCAKSDRIDSGRSAIPAPALAAMQQFSCTLIPQRPIDTMSQKFCRYLTGLRDRLFGGSAVNSDLIP